MISPQDAHALILKHVSAARPIQVPLAMALGKVLAERVTSDVSLPPFDNSAMDGYALRSAEIQGASPGHPARLVVAMEVAAGQAATRALGPGEACRIMTGSPIPQGADAVLRVEDTREEGNEVLCLCPVELGENIRRSGEDVRRGMVLLEPGTILTSARIALLAGVGRAQVQVHAAPRVAILATGDELVEPGGQLAPGQIFNSNAHALAAMVTETGGVPVMLGPAPDEPEATRRLIEEALRCDVVLTTGGVSMGRYDYVSSTLQELGTIHFDRVAQQPGKPFTFATVKEVPVFALPGNPVSTMVSFEVYVRPALRKMMGLSRLDRPTVAAVLEEGVRKKAGRQLFLRAALMHTSEGYRARLSGLQGSGILTAMAAANALLIVPAERGDVAAGETLDALVLDAGIFEPAALSIPLTVLD